MLELMPSLNYWILSRNYVSPSIVYSSLPSELTNSLRSDYQISLSHYSPDTNDIFIKGNILHAISPKAFYRAIVCMQCKCSAWWIGSGSGVWANTFSTQPPIISFCSWMLHLCTVSVSEMWSEMFLKRIGNWFEMNTKAPVEYRRNVSFVFVNFACLLLLHLRYDKIWIKQIASSKGIMANGWEKDNGSLRN